MAISPALRNFTLQRGMDWSEQYIFKSTQTDGSEVAMDLAGYTVASEAWDKDRDFKYADFIVTYTDRPNGKIKLSLTDDQTIHFPDELQYDIVLINSTGERETYVKGTITVYPGYSR